MEDNLVLKALEVLKKACKDLQGGGTGREEGEGEDDAEGQGGGEENDPYESRSMKALLVLHSESQDAGLLSADPALSTLSTLLSRLRSLYLSSYGENSGDGGGLLGALGGGIGGVMSSLLDLQLLLLPRNKRRRRRGGAVRGCRSNCREISRVAGSIESEIQSWIDRESVGHLVAALRSLAPPASSLPAAEEDALAGLLRAFEDRLSRGFDRGLQDALLRSGAFPAVAAVLAAPAVELRLREGCAAAVAAMVRFNRDVFVGHVLMGGGGDGSSSSVLQSLVAMETPSSMRVLQSLVAAIKIALVDEIHADGQIPGLVFLLSSPDTDMAAAALDLLLQVAYYARKEAVDAMMEAGIVKRLAALQRSDLGGALIEMDEGDPAAAGCGRGEDAPRRPFASCVARLAIQLEVGEGLRRRERAAAKVEILERVRDSAASDADAATIIAEVLWGASH